MLKEDLKEAELEDQATVAEDQIVEPEDLKEAELEDQVAIQQISHMTKKQDQSQKLAGKRIKSFWSISPDNQLIARVISFLRS
jgi:hypothetical protein